jgi:hypothetical protein
MAFADIGTAACSLARLYERCSIGSSSEALIRLPRYHFQLVRPSNTKPGGNSSQSKAKLVTRLSEFGHLLFARGHRRLGCGE